MKPAFAIMAILYVLTTLSSCNYAVKKERIEKIDSLGVLLNHVNESVAAVDSTLIQQRIVSLNNTGNWVIDNITDTLSAKPGIAFGDHLRCKKFYRKAKSRLAQVKAELRYSQNQLKQLRTDVDNNFYSDEEFRGYFETETAAIRKLVEATDELTTSYEAVNARYEITKPKVDSVLDSIKSIIFSADPA